MRKHIGWLGDATSEMKTILHLHIPRTAGSSLNRLFSSASGANVLHSNNADEIVEVLNAKPYAVVTGHFFWGAHVATPDHVYFIVLREPVARVWSLYRFVLSRPDEKKFQVWGDKSLAEILLTPKFRGIQLANAQVRQIAGTPVDRPVGLGEFLRAARNLARRNVVIGLPDSLAQDVAHLAYKAGFDMALEIPTVNQAPEAEMDAASRKQAARFNRYDRALYFWARTVRGFRMRQYEKSRTMGPSQGATPSP